MNDTVIEEQIKADASEIAQSIIREIQDLERKGGMIYLERGRLYKRLRDEKDADGKPLYQLVADAESWVEFLKSGYLNEGKTMVYLCIDIYQVFIDEYEYEPVRIADIPTDKLSMILPSVKKAEHEDVVEELIVAAESLSRSDLITRLGELAKEGKIPARKNQPEEREEDEQEEFLVRFFRGKNGKYIPDCDWDIVDYDGLIEILQEKFDEAEGNNYDLERGIDWVFKTLRKL